MKRRVRFGTFEFDPSTRELRRDDRPVRLQAQPGQVLAELLANAGEVVTRESLQQTVWGNGTHVDFESGLNFCIAQIRSALGDSAESPLYIKTVPKRGYQFIAGVTEIGASTPAPSPSRIRWVVAACALLLIAGLCVWAYTQRASGRPVRIAVARFDNQSGDPALDRFVDGLCDAVTAELTTAPSSPFAVIGNAAILREARNRRDLARIADELKAEFVVLGQAQKGAVLVHLIRLPDQAHMWVTRVNGPDFTDPVRTEGEIAKRAVADFRVKLKR